MNYEENEWRSGPPESLSGPYEYPALDDAPGFWAGRWAEFKRLFILLAWKNDHSRSVLIVGSVVFVLTALWGLLFS